MYKVLLFLVLGACTKTPDFSLDYTNLRLSEIEKKAFTNEDLNTKDYNILFKTLNTPRLLKDIDNQIITRAIIYSKEKNLFRAYMEAFLKSPTDKNFKMGLRKLYSDNPNLIKAYLEYFSKEEQNTIANLLF